MPYGSDDPAGKGEAMGRMETRKKAVKRGSAENIWFSVAGWLTTGYLGLLTAIYPFVFRAGYADTSYIKYSFLMGISYGFRIGYLPIPGYVPVTFVMAVFGAGQSLLSRRKREGTARPAHVSALDIAVLLYLISLVLSSLVSPFKAELWWGYPGWNMGLASQLLFIFLYFSVSRFFKKEHLRMLVVLSLTASGAVFLIGILQRFGLDIFGLYQGMKSTRDFLSTIGQATFFSSYLSVFLAVSIFLVWHFPWSDALGKLGRIHLAVSAVCLVVQGSDSAYAALFAVMSMILVFSLDDLGCLRKLLGVLLEILLCWRLAGLAQLAVGAKAEDASISVFLSQNPLMWIPVGAVFAAWLLLSRRLRLGGNRAVLPGRKLKRIFLLCAAGAAALLIVYIVLNSMRILPVSMRTLNNYLRFNRRWGHNRGAVWHDTVLSYLALFRADPLRGIFGVGADQFYHVVQSFVSDWTRAVHPGLVLTNAHNEWLTAFVNFGVFGGAAYLGIFIVSAVRNVKNRIRVPYAAAIACCAAAYMAHDFFCYQQLASTPLIFAALGLGEWMLRVTSHSRAKHSLFGTGQ